MVEWGSRIFRFSILRCWESKGGNFFRSLILLSRVFSRLDIFHLNPFSLPQLVTTRVMFGVVSYELVSLFVAEQDSITGGFYVRNFKVQSLISEHGKRWNVPLVRQVFSNDIVDAIFSTPLYDQVHQDRLIWKAERNGCYTVRSAYRLCVEELVDVSHLHRPGSWNNIWRLKVPLKVKNLLWRMCRGCLSTRVRLQDKGVSCPTNCASCGSDYKDLNHLLFECRFAIQVWNAAGVWSDVQHAATSTDSAVNFIFHMLQNLPTNIQQCIAAICWSLWKHRNLKIWENVTESSAQVVDRAQYLIDDWQEVNLMSQTAPLQEVVQQQQAANTLQHSVQPQNSPTRPAIPQWFPASRGGSNAILTRLSLNNSNGQVSECVFGMILELLF
jgi:hypothetical protein